MAAVQLAAQRASWHRRRCPPKREWGGNRRQIGGGEAERGREGERRGRGGGGEGEEGGERMEVSRAVVRSGTCVE